MGDFDMSGLIEIGIIAAVIVGVVFYLRKSTAEKAKIQADAAAAIAAAEAKIRELVGQTPPPAPTPPPVVFTPPVPVPVPVPVPIAPVPPPTPPYVPPPAPVPIPVLVPPSPPPVPPTPPVLGEVYANRDALLADCAKNYQYAVYLDGKPLFPGFGPPDQFWTYENGMVSKTQPPTTTVAIEGL